MAKTGDIVLFIVGPTASGKTNLSLRIAQEVGGEIVSADSRQVYTYMDIGTAKPSLQERQAVVHHFVDCKEPDEYFSAGEYGRLARETIQEILERGRLPVVVGGSGLYIRAVADGIFTGDYRDADLRERLKRTAEEEGVSVLYDRLRCVDPVYAERIHPNDKRRIVRALEVEALSGRRFSSIHEKETRPASFVTVFWGLRWPREVLYARIDRRVDEMMDKGLVDEVARLRKIGYGLQHNSLDSVGYKEILTYLDGNISLSQAVEAIKRNTRRFAKKQMTWFRSDARIRWIDLDEPVDWNRIATMVIASLMDGRSD